MGDAAEAQADDNSRSLAPFLAPLAVVLALVAAVFATRAIWFGNPVADIDEQLYSLIGAGLLEGELPYADNWDRKPFGLFALYALAHALGGPGPIAYQALAALFTLGGALLVYSLSRVLIDRVTATVAGALYAALMAAYASHSGQSEAFFMPLMLAMVWLVRDPDHPQAFWRVCAAMLLGGLALQIKYTALPQCVLLGLWVLWHEHRRAVPLARIALHAALFAALGLLPTLGVALFYAAMGEWDAYLFANFLSFFDRAPAPQGRFVSRHMLMLTPIFALIVGGLYAAFRMRRPADPRSYALYCLWFVSSLVTAYLPATIYGYYFAALVPAAVLVALPLLDRKGPFGPMPALLLVAGMAYVLQLPDRYASSQAERAVAERMARAIAPYVDQRRCLFVFDGPTAFYRMTRSCHPTRFIYPDHLNNALEQSSLGISQATEVRRILARRPPVIVTNDTPFTLQNEESKALVEQAIARDYALLAKGEMNGRIVRAWRFRGEPRPPAD